MIRKLYLSVAGLMFAGNACADWALNMPKGVTELSVETYGLHMMVFWWCVAIGIGVFGVMIYSMVKHRRSQGAEAAQFTHNNTIELVWTVIPLIILLVMVVPSAETMVKIEDSRNTDLTVVVTAYQWKWHYNYQNEGVDFFSSLARTSADARRKESGIDPFSVDNYLLEVDHPLVVPRGGKVRVLLTSNDVIHSWWVPELSMKKDAIPGYMNEIWFQAEEVGTYRGQCAELCGKDHGYMPIVVEVIEPEAFAAWLAAEKGNAAPVAAN